MLGKSSVLAVIFLGFISPAAVYAGCGLRGCMLETYAPSSAHTAVETGELYGRHSVDGMNISYWKTTFHAETMPTRWFRGSILLPFVSASVDGDSETGLGDMVLDLSASPFDLPVGKLWIGTQVEFPTGDQDKLLGSGHFELLPMATYRQPLSKVDFDVQMGGRFSLGDDDDHHGATGHEIGGPIADPHTSREWVYRAGASWMFLPQWKAGLSFSGQTVLTGDEKGDTFLSLGPQIVMTWLESFSARVRMELPVSADKRFDWRAGAALAYTF